MPVTHFEITELPDSNAVIALIGAAPLQQNVLYPIADENNVSFERTAQFAGLGVQVQFKWRAHNQVDGIVGNEALGFVTWRTLISNLPSSEDETQNIENSEVFNLIDFIPINDATEYIIVKEIIGITNWKVNGNNLYVNQIVPVLSLFYVTFEANEFGGGDPYSILRYTVGNQADGEQPTIYEMIINVNSIAELLQIGLVQIINYDDEFDNNGTLETYNVIEQFLSFETIKGYQSGTAEIQITIACPYLALNDYNKVVIDDNSGGDEIEKFADEVFTITAELDQNGRVPLAIRNYIVEDTTDPKTGDITIELLSINGDPALVSGTTNTITLNTNF